MLGTLAEFVAGTVLTRVVLLALVFVVAVLLVVGRDALMAAGASRTVAGSVATAAVVALCAYGLYLFATRAIDR